MEKQLAVLADSANISQEGKLNILGEFNNLQAPESPITWPIMWFVAKFWIGSADVGRHKVLLRVVDEDGNTVIPPLSGALEVPAFGPNYAGVPTSLPLVLGVANVTLPSFGTYTFELRVDDEVMAEALLFVTKQASA
jgi:hypothetical protein